MMVILPALSLPTFLPFSSLSSTSRTCFSVSPVSAESIGTHVNRQPLGMSMPCMFVVSFCAVRIKCRYSLTILVLPYHSQSDSFQNPSFILFLFFREQDGS